jgi:hypothetical protein
LDEVGVLPFGFEFGDLVIVLCKKAVALCLVLESSVFEVGGPIVTDLPEFHFEGLEMAIQAIFSRGEFGLQGVVSAMFCEGNDAVVELLGEVVVGINQGLEMFAIQKLKDGFSHAGDWLNTSNNECSCRIFDLCVVWSGFSDQRWSVFLHFAIILFNFRFLFIISRLGSFART